jgi:DNA-binding winged helix-turn-helix (wHTH) protein
MAQENRSAEVLSFMGFILDTPKKELRRGCEILDLCGKPFDVLVYLVLNRDRLIPKEEIHRQVWQDDWDSTYAANLVDQAVKEVRDVLKDDARSPVFIRTIRGRGLRFIAPTSVVTEGMFPLPPQGQEEAKNTVAQSPQPPLPDDCGSGEPTVLTPHNALSRRVALPVAGAALISAGYFILRRKAGPERAVLVGTALTALDGLGQPLWTRQLPESALTLPDPTESWRVQVLDLEGGGNKAVLVACAFSPENSFEKRVNDELYCFAPDGKLRWKIPCRPDLLGPNGEAFRNTWVFRQMIAVPGPRGSRTLWLAVAHDGRWPGCILRVDSAGDSKIQFANAGNVEAVCHVQGPDGGLIAFCGENNAYESAFIAMIDEDATPSTSPTSGSTDYRYSNAPEGYPRAYTLLPTSELSLALDNPYQHAVFISHQSGITAVQVIAGSHRSSYLQYEFSTQLKPLAVRVSGSYPVVHERLTREGLIRHTLKNCPEISKPRILRTWDRASAQWRNEQISWRLSQPVP